MMCSSEDLILAIRQKRKRPQDRTNAVLKEYEKNLINSSLNKGGASEHDQNEPFS